jgi:hypothetical protein
MKLIALSVVAALACACASSPTPAPVVASSPPPTDMELTLQDKVAQDHALTQEETVRRDNQLYQESLNKIENQFNDEKLQMEMCGSVYSPRSTQCYALLKKFCQIDTIIDTHSGHHKKPYCDKSVLDYVNPNIKHQF